VKKKWGCDQNKGKKRVVGKRMLFPEIPEKEKAVSVKVSMPY